MPRLTVFLNGVETGQLERDQFGKTEFVYSQSAVQPLSVAMPLESQRFGHEMTEAFFAGLLPESDAARTALGRHLGINAQNTFNLLRAIGKECAGAVSVCDSDEITIEEAHDTSLRVPTDAELATYIRELPKRPLFVDIDGIRISLAGAQDKAAVCIINEKVALPGGGHISTHILKPDIASLGGVPHNEYLCMRLAKLLKINVPNVRLYAVEDLTVFWVERYDRTVVDKDETQRIHQEDFCQALSLPPSVKYQSDGGPALVHCFKLLDKTKIPAISRNMLMRMVVFNYLVGNMDAHAKNFSLLHRKDGIVLAPMYDVICTRAYAGLSAKMAMKIGSKYKQDDVMSRHWKDFCDEIEFSFPAFKKLSTAMAYQLLSVLDKEKTAVQNAAPHPILDAISERITKNCDVLTKRLKEQPDD